MDGKRSRPSRIASIPKGHVAKLVLVAAAAAVTAYLLFLSMTGDFGEALPFTERGPAAESEYVLPESDVRVYSADELEALTEQERYIAINEIYARHGRSFSDQELQDYFDSCSWYRKLYSPEEYDALPSQFNEYEQANVDSLAAMRDESEEKAL